ncbi:MAG: DUF4129 domain-containing protein [Pedobacter sp.]
MSIAFSKVDTAIVVQLRHFDARKLKSYTADSDFKYDDAPVNTDWWGRFWRWFWQLLEDALGNGPSSRIVGYLALSILIAFALFIVFRILGVDLKIFSGKSKTVDVPYMEVQDNIHEMDFTLEIEKAIAANNFRLAVRLFYLRILKQLSDADQIHWQPEKTNQAYISEITDPSRKHAFKYLTDQFEYVWYGEFAINKQQFDQMKTGFENFKSKSA